MFEHHDLHPLFIFHCDSYYIYINLISKQVFVTLLFPFLLVGLNWIKKTVVGIHTFR